MQLTDEQNDALKKVKTFSYVRPFYLGGCAGTGKTTLLRTLAEEMGESIHFLAPTGKAVQVLKSKLPSNSKVQTVHSALYLPMEIKEDELNILRGRINMEEDRTKRYLLEQILKQKESFRVNFMDNPCLSKGQLVVVDESSMLATREFDKLSSLGVRLVLMGDPFQLPPVQSKSVIPSNPKLYDAFLKTVHRAAMESPITRMATEIRRNVFSGMKYWSENGIAITSHLNKDTLLEADQVITGYNASRESLNKIMIPHEERRLFVGDKLIIKQNRTWENSRTFVVNGDIGVVSEIHKKNSTVKMRFPDGRPSNFMYLTLPDDPLDSPNVDLYPSKEKQFGIRCDFGYAITVHASQGSEWDNVVLYDDGFNKVRPVERRRWFYTAITRAKSHLTIIRKK